jgi:hypothetical protein
MKNLTIFDIDETLFETTAMIRVVKDGEMVKLLSNSEYNTYELESGETFDFSEFKDAEKFFHESKPIHDLLDEVRVSLDSGDDVRIVTARCDFDCKHTFLNTFRKHDIDIDRIHVYRAGNMDNSIPPAIKKAIIIDGFLKSNKYNRVSLFDDSMSNLKEFLKLGAKHIATKFEAKFVDHGIVSEVK